MASRATVIGQLLEEQRARPNVVLVASMALTLCSFVAAGHGVSLVHPAMVKMFGERLAARPFEPAIPRGFQICRRRDNRNARLVADFVEVAHEMGCRILTDGTKV